MKAEFVVQDSCKMYDTDEQIADGSVQLVFADPPFNIGVKYDTHDDNMTPEQYLEFIDRWVRRADRALRPGGYMVICSPPEWSYEYESMMRFCGLKFHERVIWHRTFGAQSQTGGSLSKAYTDLLIYGKPLYAKSNLGQTHWDRYRVPSERLIKYGDKRADPNGKVPGCVWVIPDNPESDVWKVSMICGTYNERVGWCKCQQPIELVARAIIGLSDPGDLVFDPFAGAGTTAVAAYLLARNSISFDIDAGYIDKCWDRLKTLPGDLFDTWRVKGRVPAEAYQDQKSA